MAEGYTPGLSYSGVDQDGKSHRGNLMTGCVSAFVQGRYNQGWSHMTVVNSQGVEVAGIRSGFRKSVWFSDVA